MKYNPFKPGSIVLPGMFLGRMHEIEIIEKCLFQTKNKNPENFLIQGERGIGKSSLMLYAQFLASGKLRNSHKFCVAKIELESNYKFADIIKKLTDTIEVEISRSSRFESVKQEIATLLLKIKSSYVSFQKNEISQIMLIDNLANLLVKMDKTKNLDGILILIDEADNQSVDAKFGTLLKLLTERLTFLGCHRVCLGVSGLPETINKLRESHESSLRIFNILTLKPLKGNECISLIKAGIKDANEKNKNKQTTITEGAERSISEWSEGYPYILQQFSYSSFEADTNNIIDEGDVEKGVFYKKGNAIEQLGKTLFNDMYYKKIDSNKYRAVLKYMASKAVNWVHRSDILKHSGLKESQVNNALSALKSRSIILSNPKKRGEYKIPSTAFTVWINFYIKNQERKENKN